MNTPVNSDQNISAKAPVAGAATFTPAQLGDLVNYILCYGVFFQKFEPRLLPAGAQAEMYRCEESLSWILVWFVNGRPVMACDYFDHFTYVLDRMLLQEVIDDLAADPAVGWNCQTGGVLGNDHIHAIELEIAPIYDDGEYVETFTFEDSVSEPDRVHAFSLYSRIADSADFAGTQALHDAETLAECELMTLLALRKINHLKAGRALAD